MSSAPEKWQLRASSKPAHTQKQEELKGEKKDCTTQIAILRGRTKKEEETA
jgi:streptomycin 6-kinase